MLPQRTFHILVLLLLLQPLHAQQNNSIPLYNVLSDTAAEQLLDTSNYQILEDEKGTLNIEQASKPLLSGKFHFPQQQQEQTPEKGIYWIRYRLKNAMDHPANIIMETNSEYNDFYLFYNNSNPVHLVTGFMVPWEKRDGFKANTSLPIQLSAGEELSIYQRSRQIAYPAPLSVKIASTEKNYKDYVDSVESRTNYFDGMHMQEMFLEGLLFLMLFYNLSFFSLTKEREYLNFSLFILFLAIARLFNSTITYLAWNHPDKIEYAFYLNLSFGFMYFFLVQFIRSFFKTNLFYKVWDKFLLILSFTAALIEIISLLIDPLAFANDAGSPVQKVAASLTCLSVLITFLMFLRKNNRYSRLVIIGGIPLMLFWTIAILFIKELERITDIRTWYRPTEVVCIIWFVLFFSLILFKRFNYLRKENAQQALDKERLEKEKEIERSLLIEKQKTELEKTVEERTAELKQSLDELKSTQAQLIQSEKMASLGELTAGIAHEIQNPLNFVNNFSEVNNELIEELKNQKSKLKSEEQDELLDDIFKNNEKINHHGKRADAIVKSMLQHSRKSSGQKESTDINALCDEYLRLSYHGLRAKDKNFNADYKMDFDDSIGKINIVPQGIGRVLLNLFNNAFYAVGERCKVEGVGYVPMVTIVTKKLNNTIEIIICDNGNGIPQNIIDKIFQPFFTTKPTGEGTGLGLSLSYDIIKAHGGDIKIETKEGEGTTFIINLPVV